MFSRRGSILFAMIYIGVIISCPISVRAAVYYVDNIAGSDFDSGQSAGHAWKTIQHVNGIIGTATNVILSSENFTDAVWFSVFPHTVVTDNAVTAPDGSLTAASVIEDAATSATHSIKQRFDGLATSTIYTASIYVKPNGRNWVRLGGLSKSAYPQADFHLVGNGSVGNTQSLISAGITPVENGYYRLTVTANSGTGGFFPNFSVILETANNTTNYTGDNSSGIYIWGAQLESGSVASSYKKTTVAPASSNEFFSAGDSVLFKRGDIWHESLIAPADGASNNPITYGAYGAGSTKPELDGSIEFLGTSADWTCVGNYCSKFISAKPDVLWINNLKQPEGSGSSNRLGDWVYNAPYVSIYAGAGNDPTSVYSAISAGYRTAGAYIGKNYVRLTDLDFEKFQDNTGITYPTTIGAVVFNNSSGSRIDNCTFAEDNFGVVAYKSPNLIIDSNIINGSYVSGAGGIGIFSQSDGTVISNNSVDMQSHLYSGASINSGVGIQCYISGVTSGSGCLNAVIRDNDVSYPAGFGISLVDEDIDSADTDVNVQIYNNDLSHGNQATGDTDGIAVGGKTTGDSIQGVTIYDNRIDGYLNSGIQVTNMWHDARIYQNIISNTGGGSSGYGWGGIKTNNGGMVFNNTIIESFQDGISIGGDDMVDVNNNIVYIVDNSQAGHGNCYYAWSGTISAKTMICYGAKGMHDGVGAFSDGGGNAITDPKFINYNSDFKLQEFSPAIDVGISNGLAGDFSGQVIYGAPDIGAYEYQPPYTFSANHAPSSGSIRLYADGKYRMLVASSTSGQADFFVAPAGGNYLAATTQYLDVTINLWQTVGDKNKQWMASSTDGEFQTHATSTYYVIGDLTPGARYAFMVDGSASEAMTGADCNGSICSAGDDGRIHFTYTGGYSNHVFDLIRQNESAVSDTAGSGGLVAVILPKAIGAGSRDINVAMNDRLDIGLVDAGGCNLLFYVSSSVDFKIAVSRAQQPEQHQLTVSDLNLFNNSIILTLNSKKQIVTLNLNASARVDLDQDGKADIILAFAGIYANRAEVTLKPLTDAASSVALPLADKTMAVVSRGPTAKNKYIFTKDLKGNQICEDVRKLQQFLNSHGFVVAKAGPGSAGKETAKFGAATRAALLKFQKAKRINPVNGLFGPLTRQIVNSYSDLPHSDKML